MRLVKFGCGPGLCWGERSSYFGCDSMPYPTLSGGFLALCRLIENKGDRPKFR